MTFRRRTLLAAGLGGATLTAIGGLTWTLLHQPTDGTELTLDDILHDPDQPVLGNPEGDVTVVEFFDYQCPFCKRGHADLMSEVEADGSLRLILKDWAIFGGASVLASQLVLGAVEKGSYAAAQAALMATPAHLSEDDVHNTLTAAGLDPAAMLATYRQDRARWDGLMARNGQQAAALGLQGTPAFIIGQSLLPGALDRDRLRAAIAAARSTA